MLRKSCLENQCLLTALKLAELLRYWYWFIVNCYIHVYVSSFVFMYLSVNQDCLRQKNCSQLCQQTTRGAVCFCKPGYVLDSDGISCNGKCKFFFLYIYVHVTLVSISNWNSSFVVFSGLVDLPKYHLVTYMQLLEMLEFHQKFCLCCIQKVIFCEWYSHVIKVMFSMRMQI